MLAETMRRISNEESVSTLYMDWIENPLPQGRGRHTWMLPRPGQPSAPCRSWSRERH